ncbi:hypothetical protein NQZ79_g5646 [Umbelopsis isabellina]|nr:hypothetical protein NQZ79_g5646 [Umbelopsis isabellina]
MSVNVLSVPQSTIGNESQLDSAVHNLYSLYHSPPITSSSTSRHQRKSSRTIDMSDDFAVTYGAQRDRSISSAPAVKSKLNRIGALSAKKPDGTVDDEVLELIRNTAANARLSMPALSELNARKKSQRRRTNHDDDSDSLVSYQVDNRADSSKPNNIPALPPSPTKRTMKNIRKTAKAVVIGKANDSKKSTKSKDLSPTPSSSSSSSAKAPHRSRPVSAPPSLAGEPQRPNQPLKTIGKWLTDTNKWLNVDRNFLY